MSACLAADCPWHARIAWLASDRIIPPLAIGLTNRMNRRKIKDVESHCLCVVHARQTIPESRSAIAAAFCRSREKFIPRAEECRLAIDYDLRNWPVLGSIGAVRVGRH